MMPEWLASIGILLGGVGVLLMGVAFAYDTYCGWSK